MKTPTDRAADAIGAAEIMFAEETGTTFDLSPAGKRGFDRKDRRRHPIRRRRRDAEALMGAVILALTWG